MSHDRSGFSLVTDILDNLLHGGDREKIGLFLVFGLFLCGVGICFLTSALDVGLSLEGALLETWNNEFLGSRSILLSRPAVVCRLADVVGGRCHFLEATNPG